jgi:hypothetical protein
MRKVTMIGNDLSEKVLNFPPAFDHLSFSELERLPTRVVNVSQGCFTEATYTNLDEAAIKCNGFVGYMGPFADKIDGKLCIRFESSEACRRLSE